MDKFKVNIEGVGGRSRVIEYPCLNTSSCSPISLIFSRGTYLIELWGAGTTSGGG